MARQQKLKVFRTPIGFHDAYVAAPSRKAALAAWGSDADLFARGVAEQVTDEALCAEPLAHPGKVIRRLRGSAEEQLAALPADPPKRQAAPAEKADPPGKAAPPPKPKLKPKPKPKPSRTRLDAAEQEMKALRERHQQEVEEIRERQRILDRDRRTLEDQQGREQRAAEQVLRQERERYARQLSR